MTHADDSLPDLVDAREEERREGWAAEHVPRVALVVDLGYQPRCSCCWRGLFYPTSALAWSSAGAHVFAHEPAPLVDRDPGDEA